MIITISDIVLTGVISITSRLHRATWVQTELFLTFPPPAVQSISLIPRNAPETAGRFRIWLQMSDHSALILVWDRKVEGDFPELKVLVGFNLVPCNTPHPQLTQFTEATHSRPC